LVNSQTTSKVDYLGCGLLILSLVSLMLLITRIGHGEPWRSAEHAAMLLTGTLGIMAFSYWQTKAREPLIPPTLLQAQGSNATLLIALVSGVPLGAYTGGRLSSHLKRYKPLIIVGCTALPLTLSGIAWTVGSQLPLLTFLFLTGIALGLQFPTVLVAIQNAAPHTQLGVATACCGLVRGLGGALGAALLMSLFMALNVRFPDQAFSYLLLLCAALALAPLLIAWRMDDLRLAEQLANR
jgi:MFS family permease